MSAYDITIRVPDEDGLTRLISSLREMDTVQAVNPAKKKITRQVKPKAKIGILGKDLLNELFRKKPTWKTADITAAFVKAGFAANSASPRIAFLKKEGGIKQTAVNTWTRVNK